MELGLEEVEVEEIEMALPSRDEVEDEERRLRFLDIVVICQLSGSVGSGNKKCEKSQLKRALEKSEKKKSAGAYFLIAFCGPTNTTFSFINVQ